MTETDYTNPIEEQSSKNDIADKYGPDNPVAKSVGDQLKYQRQRSDEATAKIEARRREQKAQDDYLIENPDPFSDDSDYFGLITTGKIDNSLESVNDLDVDIRFESKDFYWDQDSVRKKFEDQYGDNAENVYNKLYAEVDRQYYNLVAQNSLLGKSGVNTAIFADSMDKIGKTNSWRDMATTSMGGIIGQDTSGDIISVEEKWADRGVSLGGTFYHSEESARQMNDDFYMDPETGEIKRLTEDIIDDFENQDDFLAFKYDANYLAQDDEARNGPRYVTVVKKGDELKASDQLVSSWDLGGGFFSNNGRENSVGMVAAMAIPKFTAELLVGSTEAANNILMVGSALIAGDSLDGTEWNEWLQSNDAWLRSHKMSSTDEALENPYSSLDGITDLVINVTSQFAAAYLMGGGVGWVAKGAMGIGKYANIAKGLGKAGKAFELSKAANKAVKLGKGASDVARAGSKMAAGAKVAGRIGLKAAKAGNVAGKALMTSMAMGDIYQVGKESGLSNREAASVAALSYAALWKVLGLSENIWKPFDLRKVEKQFVNIGAENLVGLTEKLAITEAEAVKQAASKGLSGALANKFVKKVLDKQIIKTASKIGTDFSAKFAKASPRIAAASRDAGMEGLEEVAELWTQEIIKSSYNLTSEAWHDEPRSAGAGRFYDLRDPNYFAKKMDESIQSFIGGFLGGGIMSGVRGFRTEKEIENLSQIISTGKVEDYVKVIMDGYDNKDGRLYEAHDYILTTQKREDGKGYVTITQELRDSGVKTIAEIKRDLLLQEINEIQTAMELDNIKPAELEEKIKEGEIPETVMKDYVEELGGYISAVQERSEIGSGSEMASTDNAIATTDAASATQAAATQAALENEVPLLEQNQNRILAHIQSMEDIVNGLTILNTIKNDRIQKYVHLNADNNLTNDDQLFDKLNSAQAQEINQENSNRKQRIKRAKTLAKAIKTGTDNVEAVNVLLDGRDLEENLETGESIDHGSRYLFKKDKKAIKKALEDQKTPMNLVTSNDKFVTKIRSAVETSMDGRYDKEAIHNAFNPGKANLDLFESGNIDLFLRTLARKTADKAIGKLQSDNTEDAFSKLGTDLPVLMIGDNLDLGRIDERLYPGIIDAVLKNENKDTMNDLVSSVLNNFEGQDGMRYMALFTDIPSIFDSSRTEYGDNFKNKDINNVISKLNLIKDAETQEGDKSIIDILNKYVNTTDGDFLVDNNKSMSGLVNTEAARYKKTELGEGTEVYLYKDASQAKNSSDHINAQLEAIAFTAELASLDALKEARLRSAAIRKGSIVPIAEGQDVIRQVGGVSAGRFGLVSPYSIRDSYDNFEDFFTTMYFDPLRLEHLENRSKLGVINSKEQKELDDINQYKFSIKILENINKKFAEHFDGKHSPEYGVNLINVLQFLNDEGMIDISEDDINDLFILQHYIGEIPYSNPEFSDKLTELLPSPIGQYLSLLHAKNDMQFFIDQAEHNKSVAEIGLSLGTQNDVHTESLDVYSNLIFEFLLKEKEIPEVLRKEFLKLQSEINGVIDGEESNSEVNKESVAKKFNLEKDVLRLINKIGSVFPNLGTRKIFKKKLISEAVHNLANINDKLRYKGIDTATGLGIVGDIAIALDYDVDNFYASYRDLLKDHEDIAKLVKGTPDLLQEKAAMTISGFLGSRASTNTDTPWITYIEGGLATGKSSYALGIGLKIHQINNGGQILMSANNRLQIDNIKKTGVDFKLNTHTSEVPTDLEALVLKLERDPDSLQDVDVLVFDEATFIDSHSLLEEKTKILDNLTRIEVALKTININRKTPIKLILLGDSNQNGYESNRPRVGAAYEGDVEVLEKLNADSSILPTQRNIGQKSIFGNSHSKKSLIRSRPLTAQYRAISVEIPDTVNAVNSLKLANNSENIAEDFKFSTKFGYSKTEQKFLGVNVKSKFSDFLNDSEYMEYLETRLKESTQEEPFTIGVASGMFSLKNELETNLDNLSQEVKDSALSELIKQYPDNFILASHEDMQSLSISFMVVDMDETSFATSGDVIQKQNARRKLYTSIGRGVEHVVVVTRNRFSNITASKRDNSVSTHSIEVVAAVVEEARQFSIDKIGEDVSISEKIDDESDDAPDNGDGSNDGDGGVPPAIILENGWSLQTKEGNYPRKEIYYFNDGSWVSRTYKSEDSSPDYVHAVPMGKASINIEGAETDLTIHSVFPVDRLEDIVEDKDGDMGPEGGAYQEKGKLFYTGKSYSESHDIDEVQLDSIFENLDKLSESFRYIPAGVGISAELEKERKRLNSILAASGANHRIGRIATYEGTETPFKNAKEATLALEEKDNKTLVKNDIYTIEGIGSISMSKLTSDRHFKSTMGPDGMANKNEYQKEASRTYARLKNSKDFPDAAAKNRKINYELEKIYNKQVRDIVQNASDYKFKIMLVKDDDSKTRANIVAYTPTTDGEMSNPVIIGNLINSTDYKVGALIAKATEIFEKEKTEIGKNAVDFTGRQGLEGKILISKFKYFDYTGSIFSEHTAPGSSIDLGAPKEINGEPNVAYLEALQIVQLDDAFDAPGIEEGKTLRDELIDENGDLISSEISPKVLIKMLRNQGIQVYNELFINMNTSEVVSGGSSIIFNQVKKGLDLMDAEKLIDKRTLTRFSPDQGRYGMRNGNGGIHLNNKGLSFEQAVTAKKYVPLGADPSENYNVEENFDYSNTLTRGKSIEMIETFSTLAKLIGAEIGAEATSKPIYQNVLDVNKNIRKQLTNEENKTEIFLNTEEDAVKSQIKKLSRGELILLNNVISSMFASDNLGRWLSDTEGNFIEGATGTRGRKYIKDESMPDAPIQYIIPDEDNLAKHMPTVSFSINKFIEYLENFGDSLPASPLKSADKTTRAGIIARSIDMLLKNTKFKNGVYINLDKISNTDTESYTKYYAIAQGGKIPGLDNLELFSTSTVGLTNPNIAIDLSKLEESFNGEVIDDGVATSGEVEIELKRIKAEVDKQIEEGLSESIEDEKTDMYPKLNKALLEADPDAAKSVYSFFYMTYFNDTVNAYEQALKELEPDIQKRKDLISELKTEIRDSIKDNALEGTEDINEVYGINSLATLYDNWTDIGPKEDITAIRVLGHGKNIIYDEDYLNTNIVIAKSIAIETFPKGIANQIISLITTESNTIAAELKKTNQITISSRLETSPRLKYLNKLAKPTNSLSVQDLLLNIATADYLLHELENANSFDPENQDAVAKFILEKDGYEESIKEYKRLLDVRVLKPNVDFKSQIEANWMYITRDISELTKIYEDRIEHLKSVTEPELLEITLTAAENQYKLRVSEMKENAGKGWEAMVQKKINEAPDYKSIDVLELAKKEVEKKKEKSAPQAKFIADLPSHISSFLLFNVKGLATNRGELLKYLEKLYKEDKLAAQESISDFIKNIQAKIDYLDTVHDFDSVSLQKIINTTRGTLKGLQKALSEVSVEQMVTISAHPKGSKLDSARWERVTKELKEILKVSTKQDAYNKYITRVIKITSDKVLIREDKKNLLEGVISKDLPGLKQALVEIRKEKQDCK